MWGLREKCIGWLCSAAKINIGNSANASSNSVSFSWLIPNFKTQSESPRGHVAIRTAISAINYIWIPENDVHFPSITIIRWIGVDNVIEIIVSFLRSIGHDIL